MDSEDGELFVKQLASFVRTHEKALANALQFRRQPTSRHGPSQSVSSISIPPSPTIPERPSTSASTTSSLASALSFGNLNFTSHNIKSAKLSLTPHHLFYLLSRFEELGIQVGPMKVRLENLHDSSTSANYVSFLGHTNRSKRQGSDVGSIHSVSSIRSVMSGMSSLWASLGLGSSISAARTERQKAAAIADLKYLYSAFTKIPCLRLAPDWRARMIRGYEEFPFDSAVPLHVFKNVQALEVNGIDFRQFFGWDRLADQLRSLTVKRASLDDPADILIDIVLDDMDKRRRRTSKSHGSPTTTWQPAPSPRRSPSLSHAELRKSMSAPGSPDPRKSVVDFASQVEPSASDSAVDDAGPASRRASVAHILQMDPDEIAKPERPRSSSPVRPPSSSRNTPHLRGNHKVKRSGSGSSHSSLSDSWHQSRGSASNMLAMGILPASKWRFLRHLSLADNSLTAVSSNSLAPLANTLHSLDLSSNLFTQIPDSVATLTALRALNLSQCMIDSLNSLTRNPLPAITALNLRANRLQSIAGVEKLYPLERLDLRDNRITDPLELARLTGIPDIREIWVEGNPFTRTHRDYRVTIFNLFRKTPGYTEDVIIDGMGPSYSEKRLLVDRVPLPAAVPVVRPTAPDMLAIDVSKPTIVYTPREPAVLRKERPTPKEITNEVNSSTSRRRKAAKRRIVDLATTEPMTTSGGGIDSSSLEDDSLLLSGSLVSPTPEENYRIAAPREVLVVPTPVIVDQRTLPKQNQALPEMPTVPQTLSGTTTNYSPPDHRELWKESPDWDASGEMYRRKIEALRDKVGNGYLSVLSEESRDSGTRPNNDYRSPVFDHGASIIANPPVTRSPHAPQPMIHSGRTLG